MPFKKPSQKKAQPTIEVPSLFGSHSSMINEDYDDLGDGVVWLTDEKGSYATTRDRLDTGLADPKRYDSNRVVETPNLKAVVKK